MKYDVAAEGLSVCVLCMVLFVFLYVCQSVCAYICVWVCVFLCVHLCVCVLGCASVCVCVCLSVCVCICVSECVCECVHLRPAVDSNSTLIFIYLRFMIEFLLLSSIAYHHYFLSFFLLPFPFIIVILNLFLFLILWQHDRNSRESSSNWIPILK